MYCCPAVSCGCKKWTELSLVGHARAAAVLESPQGKLESVSMVRVTQKLGRVTPMGRRQRREESAL